ncbi:MAG TPA: hypothetical protein VMO26_05510 [Vicinamibacterales bacterium]|nr:hypothetical protein [Vicinamibacterales bacterium]
MPAFQQGISHALGLAALLAAVFGFASCRSVLSVEYEYDEEVYLALDGSATVYVNASVPALVALRGAPLEVDSRARLDRNDVRAFFESPVTDVESVTTSRRDNRRYVHVRLEVADIRRLNEAEPFAWSRYAFSVNDGLAVFRQEVGPSAGRDVGNVGWTGDERVAFRLHLPSRVPFHNAQGRDIERGNIIRWEQPLAERLEGEPLGIEVHMETESILFQTLTLFGVTIVLALTTLALAIWWVMRRKGADVPGTRSEMPGTPP